MYLSFDMDPDRIHRLRLNTNPDPIRIQGFDDQKLKNLQMKFFSIYKSMPPLRKSKLQKQPLALKKEHPALQNMKLFNLFYFCGLFLPSWIQIRILKPDSDTDIWPD
jgi:hypothetical protein